MDTRRSLRGWQHAMLGFIACLILIGVALIGVLLFVPPAQHESALDLYEVRWPPQTDLCPGDTVEYGVSYRVNRPTVTRLVVQYLDAETELSISNLGVNQLLFVHPHATALDRTVPFVVPDLGPGRYERVTAITSLTEAAKPLFVVIPFTVGEGCQ